MSFLLHLLKAEVTHAACWLHLVMGLGLNFKENLNHMSDFSVLLCVLYLSRLSLTVHPLGRISPEPSRELFSTKEKAASPWRLSPELALWHLCHFVLVKASPEASAVGKEGAMDSTSWCRSPLQCRQRKNCGEPSWGLAASIFFVY